MLLVEKLLASSAEGAFIEDTFSTYAYTGTGASLAITNGINLSAKGGMVWLKDRTQANAAWIMDTVRGTSSTLQPNSTNGAGSISTAITAFGTDGFTLGTNLNSNTNGNKYISWTFREQSKFFDVVTYTGTGVARTISHNLGSVPGCIIVKRLNEASPWSVYHRGLTSAEYVVALNSSSAQTSLPTVWNSTAPTSSVFSVGTSADTNASGATYVAYLFAHNAGGFGPTGGDNAISCGSYVGTGGTTQVIDLGYEPQWVMVRNVTTGGGWVIADSIRGSVVGGNYSRLYANVTSAESAINWLGINSKGFEVGVQNNADTNASGDTYVYIAIRRGPMRKPTSGTSVYTPVTYTGGINNAIVSAGYPPDTFVTFLRPAASVSSALQGYAWPVFDRLLGNANAFYTTQNVTWSGGWGNAYLRFDNNNGTELVDANGFLNAPSTPYGSWSFRKASGFYDVVNYTGTSTSAAIPHNLQATPELMLVKAATTVANWAVYCDEIGNDQYLVLNSSAAKVSANSYWNNTAPTQSVFTVGSATPVNASGVRYAAHLFSTLPNVSKVGSYTGTAALQAINCGFSSAARFVLIKRTDSTGDWYAWDSARGIVAGNDPYKLVNTSATEVTTTDFVDTTTTGFEITAAASATVNINAASYIYLAIS